MRGVTRPDPADDRCGPRLIRESTASAFGIDGNRLQRSRQAPVGEPPVEGNLNAAVEIDLAALGFRMPIYPLRARYQLALISIYCFHLSGTKSFSKMASTGQ